MLAIFSSPLQHVTPLRPCEAYATPAKWSKRSTGAKSALTATITPPDHPCDSRGCQPESNRARAESLVIAPPRFRKPRVAGLASFTPNVLAGGEDLVRGRMELDLSGRLSTEFGELVDDGCERLGGVEFVSAGSPQKRLHVDKVAQHHFPLFGVLPIGVVSRLCMRLRSTSAGALSRTIASSDRRSGLGSRPSPTRIRTARRLG